MGSWLVSIVLATVTAVLSLNALFCAVTLRFSLVGEDQLAAQEPWFRWLYLNVLSSWGVYLLMFCAAVVIPCGVYGYVLLVRNGDQIQAQEREIQRLLAQLAAAKSQASTERQPRTPA